MAKRNINDYRDRMTSPIGIKVTADKSVKNKRLKVIYKEPPGYFTEEMRKAAEEWDREHGKKRG